jgi:hypothetical protein
MPDSTIEVDYLIKGAGAVGMAFADSILTETDATIALVDRQHRPGGHWNNAYPFVRLHQPSLTYGVNSRPLGEGAKYQTGHNAGNYELASGQEVLSHFDLVMQQRFLPSGRATFLPMSDLDDAGTATSLLSGDKSAISATKFVDATHSRMQIPSTTPPNYSIAEGMTCVPVNDLPKVARDHRSFVVIGAGKTGMDAIIWLLDNGAAPDSIRWVMPRDSWLLNRELFQPYPEFFPQIARGLADQVESIALAEDVADLFARLELSGNLLRIDPSVEPTAYHCAVISRGELDQLRRIDNIVRLGRVERIESARIGLASGEIPTDPSVLHVDCSAEGIPRLPAKPIFDGDTITLQWIRTCQPTFSAALTGFVEAQDYDEATKNTICFPIEPPTEPRDWLRMMQIELANRATWAENPEVAAWQGRSRLDSFSALITQCLGVDKEGTQHLGRYLANFEPARSKLAQLLAG